MQASECPGLTPVQERELKRAVEGTCELCREYSALPLLVIHRISRRRYREMVRDPSTRILVVCRLCHRHIHELPVRVKDQRAIVLRRSFFIRRDLRRALGYRPRPCEPPGEIDVSQIYEEYFRIPPRGPFRLSG